MVRLDRGCPPRARTKRCARPCDRQGSGLGPALREAPAGEEPIEWFLATSEPIETEADVRRVVRIYRARWLIEEFFRVLKTGCALEKRQVESRQTLEALLAIFAVVSWRILLIRHK